MKKITNLFLVALIVFNSCGEDEGLKDPGYPAEPSIAFNDLKFIEASDLGWGNTLKLTITYRDGDRDLGLGYYDYAPPYHLENLSLQDGTGDTTIIPLIFDYRPEISHEIPVALVNSGNISGTLVTAKTRENPNYSYLPADIDFCDSYRYAPYFFEEGMLDESFDVYSTVTVGNKNYIAVEDELYLEENENGRNIFVEIYEFKDGSFVKFDWYKHTCQTLNARFPVIDKNTGTIEQGRTTVKVKNPWEGQITYNIPGHFLSQFGNRLLKLQITIKDRALHTSNTLVTPPFELNEIK